MNPLGTTEEALLAFAQREQEREKDHSLPRILLRERNGSLVAVNEPKSFFYQLFSFDYSPYRLQDVVNCLMKQNLSNCSNKEQVSNALQLLDKKIKKHNNFINKILGREIVVKTKMEALLKKSLASPTQPTTPPTTPPKQFPEKPVISPTEPSPTEPSPTEPSTTEPSPTEPSTTEPSTMEPSTMEPSTVPPSPPPIETQATPDSPVVAPAERSTPTTPIGGGIVNNNSTACYVNSTLQALRVCPSFRTALGTCDTTQELHKKLTSLYQTIEANKTVSKQEIIDFRASASQGWNPPTNPLERQQDASEFCGHFFDTLGIQPFAYRMTIHHEVPFTVPSLDRQGGEETLLPISIDKAPPGSSVADLCLKNQILEVIDKEAIINAHDFIPDEMTILKLEAMPPTKQVPTLQTITFTEGENFPHLLPISLKRYDVERNKIDKVIEPSKTIDFPLAGQPDKCARFHLASCVVHSGRSIDHGHYYTYVPQESGEWVEYNDETVIRHPLSDDSPLLDMRKNGYIYFYEFVGYTDASGKSLEMPIDLA